jgi:MYXO-CTERM domain-containing protein
VWQPKGIFWDSDNDPTTDADLVAYWDGTQWVKNFDSNFTPVTRAELNTWALNPLYAIKGIEDVLNLGINYIVKVGDGVGPNFTVRMIPVVADTQDAPSYVASPPPALVDDGTGTTPDTNVPIEVKPDPVEPGDLDPVLAPVAPVVPVAPVSSGGGGGCSVAVSNAPVDPVLPLLAALGLAGLGLRRLRRD